VSRAPRWLPVAVIAAAVAGVLIGMWLFGVVSATGGQ
jgi:hypothetical protein